MKKGVQILVLIFLAQTIASCCKRVEFFDYTTMLVSENSLSIEIDDHLEMNLYAEDIEYMTSLLDFGFNESLAFDCDDGWGGMKHRIVDVSITSNMNFDSLHASNQSLDDLFEYQVFLGDGQFEFRELDELTDYSSDHLTLRSTSRPSIELSHVFTIEVTKSNGDVIAVETNEITWAE